MNNQQQQIQIKAKDENLKGVYSNFMQVAHTKEEFILDFFLVVPPNGTLNSRVVTNPSFLKRMVVALQDNIKKYEEKFGNIEEGVEPETKLGFNN
ncbi:DUF3467 domain-containing protein [Patescibacteria group bacterium]